VIYIGHRLSLGCMSLGGYDAPGLWIRWWEQRINADVYGKISWRMTILETVKKMEG
jgi:hypothetical protein